MSLLTSTCFSAVQICIQLDMIGLWGNPFPGRSEWPGDDDEPNDLENKRAHARLMTVFVCLSVHVCVHLIVCAYVPCVCALCIVYVPHVSAKIENCINRFTPLRQRRAKND